MAIPDYQSIMLPILRLAADGEEHVFRETIDRLADEFRLTTEERRQPLPSKSQPVFDNRVGWARTYLVKAGVLESPRRAVFRITDRGRDVLRSRPSELRTSFLRRFPEFVEFQQLRHQDDGGEEVASRPTADSNVTEVTPEEAIEDGYEQLRQALASDVLTRVKGASPGFFERLVVELLVKMGYGGSQADAGRSLGRSGDEGIDGTIKEDKLGLDVIYLQAKRWERTIGRPEIQQFAGALHGQRARKGVFITTSSFSAEAKDYVARIDSRIILIDGVQLASLMIDHNVGVSVLRAFEIKRIDSDYFSEE